MHPIFQSSTTALAARLAAALLLALLAGPTSAEESPTLRVLSIGVSRYQEPDMNLRFADVDARAIAAELERQAEGSIYGAVETRVLVNDEVTRESVIDAMQSFLGAGRPDDVAVLFMAGHGVQERTTRSFYFLPHSATFETLLTAGLRMSDLDVMIRAVRRNVGRIVVMLDTCYAGSFGFPRRQVIPADDLAGRLSAGEGLYLLAATTPGERSIESRRLGHGAFTLALLEALRGQADADGDGFISVSDLFSYVARRVPRLTRYRQHPYHKIEGTDLPIAAVAPDAGEPTDNAQTLRLSLDAPESTVETTPGGRNAVAVLDFDDLRDASEHAWIGRALRVALNTELSKVRELDVYSPELLDWSTRTEGGSVLTTARMLGVEKLITGSYTVVGDSVRVDVNIVDSSTGKNLPGGSDHVEGELDEFFSLQNRLTRAVLRRLEVDLSPREGERIDERKNIRVDALQLFLNAERVLPGDAPSPAPATPQNDRGTWLWGWLVRETRADERPQAREDRPLAAGQGARAPGAGHVGSKDAGEEGQHGTETPGSSANGFPEGAVVRLLEDYREAHERNEIGRLARVYANFSEEHRDAVQRYLAAVRDLQVELRDVTLTRRGDDFLVSYTRHDRFVDRKSGEVVELENRSTKLLVRKDGEWRLAVTPR